MLVKLPPPLPLQRQSLLYQGLYGKSASNFTSLSINQATLRQMVGKFFKYIPIMLAI